MKSLALAILGTALFGCGSDGDSDARGPDFEADQQCGLRLELAGALALELDGAPQGTTCMGLGIDGEAAFLLNFHPYDSQLSEVGVDISAKLGTTGKDFAATVTVASPGFDSWWTHPGCKMDLFENRLVERGVPGASSDQYRVVGSGSCVGLIAPGEGSGAVDRLEIQRLEFVVGQWQ
jgi:hypothetical protein